MPAFAGMGAMRERLKGLFPAPKAARLAALRAAWGKPSPQERDLFSAAAWHDLTADPARAVDEATWRDLDLDAVFLRADRTVSAPGRQWLYRQMRTWEEDDAVLAERSRQREALRSDAPLREAIQLGLGTLAGNAAYHLAPFLLGELPEPPRRARALLLSSLLSLACVAGFFVAPKVFFLPLLALGALHILVNLTYGRRIAEHLPGFSQVDRLLAAGLGLARLPDVHALPQLETCRRHADLLSATRTRLGLLVSDRTRGGDLVDSLVGYLNLFFLLDTVVFIFAAGSLRRHRGELLEVLEAAASLDAAISAASFREGLGAACTIPAFTSGRELRARGLRHPLLASPVPNPVDLRGRSALITGSNMAGKTTYLRTVGVNLLLGRTLHLVLAEEALLPRARALTAIRRQDDLETGRSYFFAELERILAFLREPPGTPRVLLIDEIFRGTNTVERLSAATAVLRRLGRDHLVLATTHDVELQDLLGDGYDMYHFTERVVDGACAFDYTLKPGPARTRNAIRLLEIAGYPAELTREAGALADRLEAGVR